MTTFGPNTLRRRSIRKRSSDLRLVRRRVGACLAHRVGGTLPHSPRGSRPLVRPRRSVLARLRSRRTPSLAVRRVQRRNRQSPNSLGGTHFVIQMANSGRIQLTKTLAKTPSRDGRMRGERSRGRRCGRRARLSRPLLASWGRAEPPLGAPPPCGRRRPPSALALRARSRPRPAFGRAPVGLARARRLRPTPRSAMRRLRRRPRVTSRPPSLGAANSARPPDLPLKLLVPRIEALMG